MIFTKPPPKPEEPDELAFDPKDNDEDGSLDFLDGGPINNNDYLVVENSVNDILVNAGVLLPQQEELHTAIIKWWRFNEDGTVMGEFHSDSILISIIYEVVFPDGSVK